MLRTYVLAKLGAAHLMLGDDTTAMELARRAFELVEDTASRRWCMPSSCTGADSRQACAVSTTVARQMYEFNTELASQLSHRTIFAHSSSQLGRLFLLEGNHLDAFGRLSDAMRVHLEIGDAWGLAMDFDAMGNLAMTRGRTIDAIRLIGDGRQSS